MTSENIENMLVALNYYPIVYTTECYYKSARVKEILADIKLRQSLDAVTEADKFLLSIIFDNMKHPV